MARERGPPSTGQTGEAMKAKGAYAYGGPALAITDAGVNWGLVAFMLGVFGIYGSHLGVASVAQPSKGDDDMVRATLRSRLQDFADRVDTDLAGGPA